MKTPRSAILFLRRAADACFAAGDDARAHALYSDAAHLYRQAGDFDAAADSSATPAQLRKANT